MNIEYQSLLGLEFVHGSTDCYALIRKFYGTNFGLEMKDYARPDNWWDNGQDLYTDNYRQEGFQLLDLRPDQYVPGDLILMAIRSRVANHGAVLLENGMILHHLAGNRSAVESYNRSLFRDTTVAVLRHPTVFDRWKPQATSVVSAMDLVSDDIRSKFSASLPLL